MLKTKVKRLKTLLLSLFLISCFLLCTGCKKKEVSTQADASEEDLLILTDNEENQPANIVTSKVFRGDFIRTISVQGQPVYQDGKLIQFTSKAISAVFETYLVKPGDTIKAGEPIVQFIYQGDSIAREELKIEQRNLRNSYENLKKQPSADKEQLDAMKVKLSEQEEMLKEYELDGTTGYLCAGCDGIVSRLNKAVKGDCITNGNIFGTVYDESSVLIGVEDRNALLPYGLKVKVTVVIRNESTTYEGTVISGDALVSQDLRRNGALIQVEGIGQLPLYLAKISVDAELAHVPNVLLIDAYAVNEDKGQPYITSLEGGKLVKRYFTSGDRDSKYYWVFDGLEEGMEAVK